MKEKRKYRRKSNIHNAFAFLTLNKRKTVNVTANRVFSCVNSIHYPFVDTTYIVSRKIRYSICNILQTMT